MIIRLLIIQILNVYVLAKYIEQEIPICHGPTTTTKQPTERPSKWIECSEDSVYMKIGQELLLNEVYLDYFLLDHENATVTFQIIKKYNIYVLFMLVFLKNEMVSCKVIQKIYPSNLQYPLVMYLNSTSICKVHEYDCEMTCSHWNLLKIEPKLFYNSNMTVSNDRTNIYLDIGCKNVLDRLTNVETTDKSTKHADVSRYFPIYNNQFTNVEPKEITTERPTKWIECDRECSEDSFYIKIDKELFNKENELDLEFFRFEHNKTNVIFKLSKKNEIYGYTRTPYVISKSENRDDNNILNIFLSDSQNILYLNSSHICSVAEKECRMICRSWHEYGVLLENFKLLKSESNISYISDIVVSNDRKRMYSTIGCKSVLHEPDYKQSLKETILKIIIEIIELLKRMEFNSSLVKK